MTSTVGLSALCANAMLNAFRHVAHDVTAIYGMLHTDPPGAYGDNALSAGDPSLKLLTFSAASNGAIGISASPTWTNGGTSETLQYLSTWNGSTGPGTDTLQWVAQLTTPQTWASGDTYTLDSCGLVLVPIVNEPGS